MSNIKLNYRYRDYANYKNYGEAIFANPDKYSLEQIDALIRTHLLDGAWFYASRWGLKDLHFKDFDDENDHPYHEFLDIELTDEAATESLNMSEFIEKINAVGANW